MTYQNCCEKGTKPMEKISSIGLTSQDTNPKNHQTNVTFMKNCISKNPLRHNFDWKIPNLPEIVQLCITTYLTKCPPRLTLVHFGTPYNADAAPTHTDNNGNDNDVVADSEREFKRLWRRCLP